MFSRFLAASAVDLAPHFVSVSPMANKRISRLFKILYAAVGDDDEIFQLDGRVERFVHFWALVVRQFTRYRCFVRASALSFSTLLALIPLLAVALSVTSSLLSHDQEAKLAGFVEKMVSSVAPPVVIATNAPPANVAASDSTNGVITTNLTAAVAGTNLTAFVLTTNGPATLNPAAADNVQRQVADEIHGLVKTASNGTLGSIGLIFLVITAVSLLRGIEETFNDMWGVTRGRNWWLQSMLYWCIITVGPLFISTTLGFTSSAHFERTRAFLEASPFLSPIYRHVLPIAILSISLGLFYKLTPNTKVEFSAAMIGGFCSGTAWHFYNQISFLLVSRAVSASKLYGSLMLLVLVMGGLYILWLIILFGAQIAYAYQNRTAYLQDRLAENVNQRGREFVALRIMTAVARRFQAGQSAATVPQISSELGVPSRLTQSVLRILTKTCLVTEVAGAEAAFVPARPLEVISVHDILIAMRTGTGQELPLSEAPELAAIYGEFARIEAAERNAASRVCLITLANRLSPAASLPAPEVTEPKILEPEKPVSVRGAIVSTVEPSPIEPSKPAPVSPTETLPPPPAPEQAQPRRETVRPAETDFPL